MDADITLVPSGSNGITDVNLVGVLDLGAASFCTIQCQITSGGIELCGNFTMVEGIDGQNNINPATVPGFAGLVNVECQ